MSEARDVVRPGRGVAGVLAISLPVSFGLAQIGPLFPALLAAHPRLKLDLRFEDRAIDQIIFALRRKLAQGEAGRRLIQSIRGQGYSLLLGDQEPADWPRTPE